MTLRTMSFRGCKTRDEARERLRGFLEGIHEPDIRRAETDLLIDAAHGIVDVESIDETIAAAREHLESSIDAALIDFTRILKREGIGPRE